ncbi:MAG: protein-glutamate O-methyltransferase CheR [Thaumarchaeota archaeon]|nr:protein-glutamate O-methyltransferase CheR [Nitrososphaerota archaeon]
MSLNELTLNSQSLDTFSKVFESYGSDIKRFKPAFMKRRLDRRMRMLEINNYYEYALILKRERREFEELFASLSINVTDFFRDFAVYEKFRSSIIPKILTNLKLKDKIRIWSAGCASGEEAYSLAMMFSYASGKNFDVEIVANDINKNAIEYAQNGLYPAKNIEKLPENIIKNNFKKISNSENIEEYEVLQSIKNLVTFKVSDILSCDVTQYDVIFCRNVLIYYEKETQELIMEKFNRCLKESGYLVLGMDETMLGRKCAKLFHPIMPRERIYQKMHSDKLPDWNTSNL